MPEDAQPGALGQFEILFAASPVPAWVADIESFLPVEVNQAALDLYGYSREEFLALDVHLLRVPEDRDALAREIAGLPAPHGIQHAHHLTRDGRRLDVEVHTQAGTYNGRKVRVVQVIDRTERAELEERYRRLWDLASDALFTLDLQGRFTSVNRMACEISGFSAEQLIGRNALELVAEESRGEIARALQEIWAGREVEQAVTELIMADGRRVWFEVRGRTLQTNGVLEGTFHIARDITERMEAEKTRAWLEAVVRSSGEAVIGRDMDRRITSWNPAAEHLYGYTAEEAIGGAADFLDPNPDEIFRAPIPGRQTALDVVRRRKDGSLVEVRHLGFTVTDQGGRVIGVAGLSHDIGPEKAAQRALNEAQSWLRAFANEVPAVIWAIDRDGTFRLLEGGKLAHYGLKPGELVGKSIFEFNAESPDRLASVRRVLSGEQFTEAGSFGAETYEAHYIPLFEDAQVSGAVAIIFDVTARQAAEAARRQAEKMESLTILAGGVAHDFNNLLVGIMGNASLALLDLESDTPSARRAIEAIIEASQRAAELAKQMLAFSGRSQVSREPCDLSSLVGEVILRDGLDLPAAALSLDPAMPPVLGDAAQLRILSGALITNAIEAAAENGGSVSVATRVQHFTADRFLSAHLAPALDPGRYAVLEVSDTGPGIAAELIPRIFEPFYTTRFAGRGLGLAAALGIVRAHRGAIFVESAPGAGTKMTVCLPLVP